MAETVGTAERRIRGHLARTLTREEIDQLLGDLAREVLRGRGGAIGAGVPAPKPDDAHYARERALREQLLRGEAPFAWAVGLVVCPSDRCPAGPLAVFKPNRGGRVPLHRWGTYGEPCEGVGGRPGLLQLASTTDTSCADTAPKRAVMSKQAAE